MVAGGVEAQNDSGPRGILDPEALDADRNTTIGADLDGGARAPNVRPPGTSWRRAKDGPLLLLGECPGLLRGHPQFAMGLMNIAMEPQSLDMRVGDFNAGNLFAGEIGWEAALPELVFAFDLSFGLRRRGIKKANIIELECPAQLGQRFGILGEENAMIIDVDLQRSSVAEEGSGKKTFLNLSVNVFVVPSF